MRRFRLCDLPFGVRLGLIGLVLTLMGGLVASLYYMKLHYGPRDGDPSGVSYVDIASAYHPMRIPAPLLTALERGHPDELVDEPMPQAEREALIEWLGGDPGSIMRSYEDETLEEMMPAEIIFRRCVDCHDENPANAEHPAPRIPLYTPAEVQAVAISRDIEPTPIRILAASTHAHALALAVQTILVVGLLFGTRAPRALVSIVTILLGFSLLADMGAWWLARQHEAWIAVILIAGGVFNALSGLVLGTILLDLLWPRTSDPHDRQSE